MEHGIPFPKVTRRESSIYGSFAVFHNVGLKNVGGYEDANKDRLDAS